MQEDVEMILIIAEALSNEFPGQTDYVAKATRIYNIMKLEDEHEAKVIQAERIEVELKAM